MGAWSGFFKIIGIVLILFAFVSLMFAGFAAGVGVLFSALMCFCTSRLFSCIDEILKNQKDIIAQLNWMK